MKKNILLVALITLFISCKAKKEAKNEKEDKLDVIAQEYASGITFEDVEDYLFTLASDKFQGRKTGEDGQKMAAKYIAKKYHSYGIPKYLKESYYHVIPKEFLTNPKRNYQSKNDSENVVAYIEGTEKPDEIILISSHYDHEGIKNEKIYNGADDNASGTTGVLLVAKAFAKAKKEGHGPKRSIMFVNFTGEEKGLLGSKYFTNNPIVPLKNIVANLNIDMIGRIGKDRKDQENADYIYVIGADRLSTELHDINEEMNKKYTQLELDYKYNADSDPNRFYFRSDHYNFAKNGIPIIFYFNGVHADYHKPTDTAEKILIEPLIKRTKLVFHTAWELANRDERIVVDVKQD